MTDQEQAKNQRKRSFIAKEIVVTERQYVSNLKTLFDVYLTPLTQKITSEQSTAIFSNVQIILQLNKKFLQDLDERLQAWDENQQIGDVFIDFAPYFKMYTQYINNHGKAVETMAQLEQQSKKFKKACESCRKDPRTKGGPLASFLILPIQRVPRYKLLLEQMVKYTDEDHADLANLKTALSLIGKVATQINEEVRSRENRDEIITLQDKFFGSVEFVTPTRKLVHQGGPYSIMVNLKDHRQHSHTSSADMDADSVVTKGNNMKLSLILFNDLLVSAQSYRGKFKTFREIPVNEMSIELPGTTGTGTAHSFRIEAKHTSLAVTIDDEKERSEWVEMLQSLCSETYERTFLRAVGSGDTATVRVMLDDKHVDIRSKDKDGWTALHYAAHNGDKPMMELLLAHPNCDMEARNQKEQTPLAVATQSGKADIVRLLCSRNACVTCVDAEGYSPLAVAHLVYTGKAVSIPHMRTSSLATNFNFSRGPSSTPSLSSEHGPARIPSSSSSSSSYDLEAVCRFIGHVGLFQSARSNDLKALDEIVSWGMYVSVNEPEQHTDNDNGNENDGNDDAKQQQQQQQHLANAKTCLAVALEHGHVEFAVALVEKAGAHPDVYICPDNNTKTTCLDLINTMDTLPKDKKESLARVCVLKACSDITLPEQENKHQCGAVKLIEKAQSLIDIQQSFPQCGSQNDDGHHHDSDIPLVLAARAGRARVVTCLLDECDVDINTVDPESKHTALVAAIENDRSSTTVPVLVNHTLVDLLLDDPLPLLTIRNRPSFRKSTGLIERVAQKTLFQALRRGQLSAVTTVLELYPDYASTPEPDNLFQPSAAEEYADANKRRTPLMLAAVRGHTEIVDMLLSLTSKSDNNDEETKQESTILLARDADGCDIADIVFSDTPKEYGSSSAALGTLRDTIAAELLRVCALMPAKDEESNTILLKLGRFRLHRELAPHIHLERMGHALVKSEKFDVLAALIAEKNMPPEIDNSDTSLMLIAAAAGHAPLIQVLLGHASKDELLAVTPDEHKMNALQVAASRGHNLVVHSLLSLGEDQHLFDVSIRDAKQRTPLMLACRAGSLSCCSTLLKYGSLSVHADKDADGKTCFDYIETEDFKGEFGSYIAFRADSANLLRFLREQIPQLELRDCQDTFNRSLVMYAAQFARMDVLRYLVEEEKCRLNESDVNGWTPLLFALREDHEEVVKYILDQKRRGGMGVAIDAIASDPSTGEQVTALYFAKDDMELRHILLECGATQLPPKKPTPQQQQQQQQQQDPSQKHDSKKKCIIC